MNLISKEKTVSLSFSYKFQIKAMEYIYTQTGRQMHTHPNQGTYIDKNNKGNKLYLKLYKVNKVEF